MAENESAQVNFNDSQQDDEERRQIRARYRNFITELRGSVLYAATFLSVR